MTAEAATAGWLSKLKAAIGPRGGVALLVAAHGLLIIAFSHPALEEFALTLPWQWATAVSTALQSIHFAQVGLIAALALYGSGHWFLRWPRSTMLVVWLAVAQVAGSWLLAGNRDGPVFKNHLLFNGLHFLFFVPPLGLIRLALRRRFQFVQNAMPQRLQFRLAQLLLLICELAVLFALVRAMVPYNRRWLAELRENLPELGRYIDWGFWLVAILAIAPAIIAAAWPGRRLRVFSILAAYELALIVIATIAHVAGIRWVPTLWFPTPSVGVLLWDSMSAATALSVFGVATVWLTLACVRCLGYEFLPLPRRGGGRQSSEATSAA